MNNDSKNITQPSRQKTCFVIMPISNTEGYEQGHFRRVFEFLIKPACKKAGFDNPVLASDVNNTNIIILDILKKLVTVDMTICDLSTRNPNVMYELGIRQAFNLPVTLIKDQKTLRVFDISSLRDIEYDESLRIDTIDPKVNEIAENIKNTYEKKDPSINSLIELLGIPPATLNTSNAVSHDTSLLLNSISNLNGQLVRMENRMREMEFMNKVQFEKNIEGQQKLFDQTYDEFKKAIKVMNNNDLKINKIIAS